MLDQQRGAASFSRMFSRRRSVLLVGVHGEEPHTDVWVALRDLARGLQTGLARHVQDRQVNVLGQRPVDRLCTVACLGHNRRVRLVVEDEEKAAQHDLVVVGDGDAGLERNAIRAGAPRCYHERGRRC